MKYPKEIRKVSSNQIVFPIPDTGNIGDSLSSINYNFETLDVYTCNFEFSASNIWNNIYTIVNDNSANWVDAMTTFSSNSGCWDETYTTVKNLSGMWLKPISLIYPYPFNIEGSEEQIINEITTWVNQSLPVNSQTCVNFIVGQELFIFTPQYSQINKIFSQEKTTGTKTVQVSFNTYVIGRSFTSIKNVNVDCGSQRLDIEISDQFVSNFTALKFIVNPAGSEWIYDSALYE